MNTTAVKTAENGTAIVSDVTLDLRGVSCPLPPLKTLKALIKMEPGQVLEVLGTSPGGKRSAPFAAKVLGNSVIGSYMNDEGHYHIFYRKN